MRLQKAQRRRGSVLPLVVIGVVALCGFAALAVDIGMVMIARTQCQNAADAGAVAGARSLDGSAGGNQAVATANAIATACNNSVISRQIVDSEVSVRHGAYHYDYASMTFTPQFPPVSPDNYNLTECTVTHSRGTAFAKVWNRVSFDVGAVGTAAHRPRDVAVVLDFSGSMNNESDLWNNESYLGTVNNTSNNTDPVFPKFGYYDPTFSPAALMQCTSSDPRVGKCNVTQPILGVSSMVGDFYQNARGAGTGTLAFTPAPAVVTSTVPGGDKPLNRSGSPSPARTWQDITGSALVGFRGYGDASFNGQWFGYTQGPNFWGKTFFLWPPEPTTDATGKPRDWRKKFLMLTGGSAPNFGGPLNDNRKLWDTTGAWLQPSGNYVINYKAILDWIQNTGPAIFPPQLRAGNILYYDAIPTDVPASAYTHTNLNTQITDPNQRFWKEYIDYVVGVWRDPYGNVQTPGNPACSIGPDFICGTSTGSNAIAITGPDFADPLGRSYIAPTDNPKRPRHRFWFGPMTMIQFMSDTGLLPGTAHDLSMYAAKLGIAGALQNASNNHPNDLVSMCLFSRPHYTGEPAEGGAFSNAQFNLSRDYAGMINGLWFPPSSASADVRPWDPNGLLTPRAHADYNGNTATGYGLMLAYNQFSGNSSLRTQVIGGFGRKGAQRLVILETDGMANVATGAGFANNGANQSYYRITPSDTVTTTGAVSPGQNAIDVATKLAALDTDAVNGPGYSTASKPLILHCIAFGAVFEPTAQGSEPANAMAFLQSLSAIGNTGFPSSVTDTGSPDFYKICTGTLQDRQDKLRTAFTRIFDAGVAVILVK
jgi:Flp pilus assembly protein TadG